MDYPHLEGFLHIRPGVHDESLPVVLPDQLRRRPKRAIHDHLFIDLAVEYFIFRVLRVEGKTHSFRDDSDKVVIDRQAVSYRVLHANTVSKG